MKGGLFDANTGNPWCHKECGRVHPNEILKMVKALESRVQIFADLWVKIIIFVTLKILNKAKEGDEFTVAKVKYTIASVEKDNTLLLAFAGEKPLVLKIVSQKKLFFY